VGGRVELAKRGVCAAAPSEYRLICYIPEQCTIAAQRIASKEPDNLRASVVTSPIFLNRITPFHGRTPELETPLEFDGWNG